MARLAALSAVLVLAGCVKHSRTLPDILPPPGTGQLRIAMAGDWVIEQIELVEPLESLGDWIRCLPRPWNGLMPPFPGATITLAADEFLIGNKLPLRREDFVEKRGIERYVNWANGQLGWYELVQNVPGEAGPGRIALKIALATIDEQRIVGTIVYERERSFAGCDVPAGRFNFIMRRY